MFTNEVIFKFEKEIRFTIKNEVIPENSYLDKSNKKSMYEFTGVMQDQFPVSQIIGALSNVYIAGSFLSVYRIIKRQ